MAFADWLWAGRKWRISDVYEFTPLGWQKIAQGDMVRLDDNQAYQEVMGLKTRYYRPGRIYRLWTWENSRWNQTHRVT